MSSMQTLVLDVFFSKALLGKFGLTQASPGMLSFKINAFSFQLALEFMFLYNWIGWNFSLSWSLILVSGFSL